MQPAQAAVDGSEAGRQDRIVYAEPASDPVHFDDTIPARSGIVHGTTTERSQELKPNYQFDKRQRELEKKKKKAEKELRKATSTEPPPAPEAVVPPEQK